MLCRDLDRNNCYIHKERIYVAGRYKAGDTAFIVESNRFIREVEVRSCSGGIFLVKFKDNGGGNK